MGTRVRRVRNRKPVIEDVLYGYQPPSRDRLELLVIVHHWSGLPDNRHAISVTYVGDIAGERQRKNATQPHTSTSAKDRFGLHVTQFLKRRIVIPEDQALGHYERLSGPHTACPECGHIGPIGAIFCGDLRPLGRADKAPPPLGCGWRFANTPARQAINA